jgi:cellulose synthase/poly-beta-1,6-N-acetylglucosamine synthase-like glycosyltransferase/peptidoglycan/xylan/chitin deacetylase (PgdA/CDA1 family)
VSGRRASSRQPRAHWILLTLGLIILLAELCLNGVIRHVGAEGAGAPVASGGGTAGVPTSVSEGGPVVRIAPDGSATARGLPDGTVALTFDDGPDPVWTPRILDVLARYHAHATFFVIGSQVNEYPDLVRRIVAEGNEVGVHTFTHPDLGGEPSWRRQLELTLTANAIAAATGRTTTLMRPPYASEPDAVRTADYAAMTDAARSGYLIVLADHDTRDWAQPGVSAIESAATPANSAGAVVMMHDGGGDRSQTVDALNRLLPALEHAGYQTETVSQALGLPAMGSATTVTRVRGEALRMAQLLSGFLAQIMIVLLNVAVVLSLVRLAVQLITARIHVRRRRTRHRRRLAYLGPVSVIVPAYNEAANIADTVRSLVRSDYPHVEVIVVDDGSTDDTATIVARLRLPNVQVIRQPNAGKPSALNTGIRAARSDIVILVDGDTVFERDAVGRLIQPFTDPDIGGISGNTKVANRRGLLGRWQHLEYVMGFNLDRRMFEIGECMPTIPGAIGAFRRRALGDVGGVPSTTLAEDTDLTMAVVRSGWRVVYEESAIAWTEAPSTLHQLWRQRYRWCFGTMQAMWKHRAALVDGGASGRLGRRGLLYLTVFQLLLPLAAPAVDIYGLYGLLFLPWLTVLAVWSGFLLLQAMTAAYALRLDGERLGPLWTLPLQQVVYRQLMYLVVIQSMIAALSGIRLRWQRVARIGVAGEALGAGRPV